MRNVTDEVSNPFGMRPPCEHACAGGDRRAVFGFGDANADFHVVGDHPGVHGGTESGVPFTGSAAVERLLDALASVGLLERASGENGEYPIEARNCFLSYRHACCLPDGEVPDSRDYAALEPFFDAELRAISAHVLLPVGDRTTEHVIETYTARGHRIDGNAADLHASEIQGRGFLVVPVADPREWGDGEAGELVSRLESILARDYRQTADLGRFSPGGDPYLVR